MTKTWDTLRGLVPRRKRLGASPGSIDIAADALPPQISVIAYGTESFEEGRITSADELADWKAREHGVIWVNIEGLGDEQVLRTVGETFGLHPLMLEDVVNVGQRPKLDDYEGTLFIVLWMLEPGDQILKEQLGIALGDGFVITFQQRVGDCLDPVRNRIRRAKGRIRRSAPDYLVYAIVDTIVDHYAPVLEVIGDRIEGLEDRVLDRPTPSEASAIQDMRRELLGVRKVLWPLREAVGAALRRESDLIHEDTVPFLRDCLDHVTQSIEITESYRELGSSLMELYLSTLSHRMNEVMKVLTIIATIFIPMTFISSIYGMNFDPNSSPLNMPETRWYLGYPLALAFMVALACVFLVYFRRKGWIGGS